MYSQQFDFNRTKKIKNQQYPVNGGDSSFAITRKKSQSKMPKEKTSFLLGL
jgi:hypothetical protein